MLAGTQLAGGLQAVHARHSDIDNDQVGIEVTGLFKSVNAVDSFAANLEAWLTFEKMTGCQANQFAVVHEENVLCHVTCRIR